ncbi:hypothetical protein [uncultured Slackia sp.]|uniref:hypothetical protein n=1 Tax=uncultured Slackia sp. TaxID=665903 RepID=UPI0026DF2AA4|nr:hypothetical protein [uncultured Slackia sp.]
MDNISVRNVRDYRNLAIEFKPLHWLDVPSGAVSAMAKANLGHQMRYSVEALEDELERADHRHVLQLECVGGTERDPECWSLYADGVLAASGSGAFARACFEEDAEAFKDVCRGAVEAAEKDGLSPLREHDFRPLRTCRAIAAVEGRRSRA